MARPRTQRVYARHRNGITRWYEDFRDFKAKGGTQGPLVAPGKRFATTNETEARELAEKRLQELRRLTAPGVPVSREVDHTRLGHCATYHIARKRGPSGVSPAWADAAEGHLDLFCLFLGEDKKLAEITPGEIGMCAEYLASLPSLKEPSSRRKYINSGSNLFRRAISESVLPLGHNPVKCLLEMPSGLSEEQREFLEVWEAALLLHVARLRRPRPDGMAIPYMFEIITTLLLTGGAIRR